MGLTTNLFVCHDQGLIIDFLVDNNEMPREFSKSQLKAILKDEDLYLIIFTAQAQEKQFVMYYIQDFPNHINDMIYLWRYFDLEVSHQNDIHVMRLARNKIHDLIAMSETMKAIFNKNR
jgi:hypothetical protein